MAFLCHIAARDSHLVGTRSAEQDWGQEGQEVETSVLLGVFGSSLLGGGLGLSASSLSPSVVST